MRFYLLIFASFFIDIVSFGFCEKPCLFLLLGMYGLLVFHNKFVAQVVALILLTMQFYLYFGMPNILVVALILLGISGYYIKQLIHISPAAFCSLFFTLGFTITNLAAQANLLTTYTWITLFATIIVLIGILKFLVKVDRVIAV